MEIRPVSRGSGLDGHGGGAGILNWPRQAMYMCSRGSWCGDTDRQREGEIAFPLPIPG